MVVKAGPGATLRILNHMTTKQNAALVELLRAWNRREDVRSSGADVYELGIARIALDDSRSAMFRTLAR